MKPHQQIAPQTDENRLTVIRGLHEILRNDWLRSIAKSGDGEGDPGIS